MLKIIKRIKSRASLGQMEPVPAGVSARGHPERREGEQHPHPTENDQGTPPEGRAGTERRRCGWGRGPRRRWGIPGEMRGWRGVPGDPPAARPHRVGAAPLPCAGSPALPAPPP